MQEFLDKFLQKYVNPVGIDVLKIPGRTSLEEFQEETIVKLLEELLYKYQRKFFKDKRLRNQV